MSIKLVRGAGRGGSKFWRGEYALPSLTATECKDRQVTCPCFGRQAFIVCKKEASSNSTLCS